MDKHSYINLQEMIRIRRQEGGRGGTSQLLLDPGVYHCKNKKIKNIMVAVQCGNAG